MDEIGNDFPSKKRFTDGKGLSSCQRSFNLLNTASDALTGRMMPRGGGCDDDSFSSELENDAFSSLYLLNNGLSKLFAKT